MFGVYFKPLTNDQVTALATPPSGNAAECIFTQYYDTQLFTSAATVQQRFFATPNADQSLSNLPQGGQLPAPQLLQVYDVTFDILPAAGCVSTSTGVGGILNDMALILMGGAQRGNWTFSVSNKTQGPYSLAVLHGTGGPTGWGWSSDGTNLYQFARNDPSPGWNFTGRQIIPQQVNFFFQTNWAAVATLENGNPYCRLSMFGVLNRKTL